MAEKIAGYKVKLVLLVFLFLTLLTFLGTIFTSRSTMPFLPSQASPVRFGLVLRIGDSSPARLTRSTRPARPPAEQVVEKDVILILDVSGSMEGEKMEQARDALKYVLDHLNQGIAFNCQSSSSLYSSSWRVFNSLTFPPLTASPKIL